MKVSYFINSLLLILFLCACGGERATKTSTPTSEGNAAPKTYAPSIKTTMSMIIPEMTAKSGEQVCTTVKVKDFEKIVSLQHSVSWDPKVLKLEGVSDFKLKSMSKGSFGLTYADKGSYGVSWYDPAIKGISMPDNAPIYKVCFTAIGAAGTSSPVRISSDPVKIEVSNAAERLLGMPTGNGKVTIE